MQVVAEDYIRIQSLSKTFGDVVALRDIDIAIEQGSFVSIVGPSGCGKSTLLRIVAGLLDYEQGSVSLDGQPIHGTRRDVGFVFQSSILLPWRTILENVMLPAEVLGLDMKKARDRAMQLLHMVRLDGFEDKLPRQLSGGMQQRASIARALLHDPKILLMDEPFGALDALTRLQVRTDLEALWLRRRPTVLFITHSVEEAVGLSDRILVMSPSPGEVVDDIRVDLPRPRPIVLGDVPEFATYVDRIHREFEQMGVLHGAAPAKAAS